MQRVQPPPFCLLLPLPPLPSHTRAHTHGTWAGFPRSVPRLGWEFSFPKEAEPVERAEGPEPQVTPRQCWPPLSLAGWPGKGPARLALLWKSGLPGKWIP